MNSFEDRVNKKLAKMTLKEKLGQLLVVGFPSPYYDDHIRTLVEEYKVGNVIIFKRNFENVEQIKELNKKLTLEIVKNTGVLPFIAVDQEGGNVVRIDSGAVYPPSAMTTAASYKEAAYDTGKMIGDDLIRLGFNLNFAPVLDINTNLDNPALNIRSYGDNKYEVTRCGASYLRGLKEFGIVGCLKHYPSYGACSVDAHLDLPFNDESFEKIDDFDLYPYYNIKDEEMIMTAHVIYNDIDKDYPGSISKKAHDILRNKIGYKGLTITDCLEMNAIVERYTTEKGARLAIEAGGDMVCICHTLERQIGALKEIEKAINEGKISIEDIDYRVKRILQVKIKLLEYSAKYFETPDLNLNKESHKIAQRIVDESLTKILGDFKLTDKTLIVAPTSMNFSNVEDNTNPKNIANSLRNEFPNLAVMSFNSESLDSIKNKLKDFDQILFFTYVGPSTSWEIDIINEIAPLIKTNVISLRGPFDYHKYHDIVSYMCLYEYTSCSIQTIIKFLKKELYPIGKSPMNIS